MSRPGCRSVWENVTDCTSLVEKDDTVQFSTRLSASFLVMRMSPWGEEGEEEAVALLSRLYR